MNLQKCKKKMQDKQEIISNYFAMGCQPKNI